MCQNTVNDYIIDQFLRETGKRKSSVNYSNGARSLLESHQLFRDERRYLYFPSHHSMDDDDHMYSRVRYDPIREGTERKTRGKIDIAFSSMTK